MQRECYGGLRAGGGQSIPGGMLPRVFREWTRFVGIARGVVLQRLRRISI